MWYCLLGTILVHWGVSKCRCSYILLFRLVFLAVGVEIMFLIFTPEFYTLSDPVTLFSSPCQCMAKKWACFDPIHTVYKQWCYLNLLSTLCPQLQIDLNFKYSTGPVPWIHVKAWLMVFLRIFSKPSRKSVRDASHLVCPVSWIWPCGNRRTNILASLVRETLYTS